MKAYIFISAIALVLLATSCSSDNDETAYTKPEQTKNFDSFNNFSKEGDTVTGEESFSEGESSSEEEPFSEGDPLKPKGKD